jgi:YesN/AraC family two-component response regulator
MKVLIVDDERRARGWLRKLVEALPDVQVAGEAEDGIKALELQSRIWRSRTLQSGEPDTGYR